MNQKYQKYVTLTVSHKSHLFIRGAQNDRELFVDLRTLDVFVNE